MSKADYVRSQPHVAGHHCHWPGCNKPVPPAMWGCKTHWFKLPARLRSAIWRTYRPGQEITKDPSQEYLKVALAVQDWIAAQQAPSPASAERSDAAQVSQPILDEHPTLDNQEQGDRT